MKKQINIIKKIILILITIYLIVFSLIPKNNQVYALSKDSYTENSIMYNIVDFLDYLKTLEPSKIYVQKIFKVGSNYENSSSVNDRVNATNTALSKYCNQDSKLEFKDTTFNNVSYYSEGDDVDLHLSIESNVTWWDKIKSILGINENNIGNYYFIGDSYTVRLIGPSRRSRCA